MTETDILHSPNVYVGSAYANISSASFAPGFDILDANGRSLNAVFKNVPSGGSIKKSDTWYSDYCIITGITQAEYNQYKSLTFTFSNANFWGASVEIRESNPKSTNGEIKAWLKFPAQTNGKSTVELPTVNSSTGYVAFWISGPDEASYQISGITALSIKTPYDDWVNDYGSSITGDIKTGTKAKAADVKNLATALNYEFQRRDNFINDSAGSLANQAPAIPNIAAGEKISSSAGMDIVSKILIINDYPNLKEQTQGSKILYDGYSTNLIDQVKALGTIEKTDSNTGCRAACTGLCLETCYTGCGNGCSSSSKQITINCTACDKACTENCGSGCTWECYGGCSGSCGGGCASSCVGNCSGSCMTNCGTGCGASCRTTCSGCSDLCWTGCSSYCAGTCSGSCYGGCASTCSGGAGKPTAPSSSSCNGCSFGCLSTCSSGCVNLTK